jgi:hypothetical protein
MSAQNSKTSFTLQLELNKHQVKCLEQMNGTGLYGFSLEETATRLLDSQLIHFGQRRPSARPFVSNPTHQASDT